MNDGYLILPDNVDYWDFILQRGEAFDTESKSWSELMGNVVLDCLTDFDGTWDFEADGLLGVIEVSKQDTK